MVNRANQRGFPESIEYLDEPEHSTSIKLSDVLRSNGRLEASAFNVETRIAVDELRGARLHLRPLTDSQYCTRAHNAFRFKRVFVSSERGVPFLSSSDIIKLRHKPRHYLSRSHTHKLNDLKVDEWDVLISCSGTIGNVSLASPAIKGFALSQHAIRVTAPNPETAGYVAAFLRSRYGRLQLTHSAYGSVVTHIEPEHLENILVPEVPFPVQLEIGTLMLRAAVERDEANRLIDEAQAMLRSYLGLPDLASLLPSSANPRTRSVRLSQWEGRLDASYHNRLADEIIKQLSRSPATITTIGDPEIVREIRAITKFRKRVYVRRGGIPLLSSKQILQVDPIEVKSLARGAHTKDLEEIGLETDAILVSRSGTIGNVQIVPSYMAGWTASEHCHRIFAVDPAVAGYIYAWLESPMGAELIKRFSYASVILHVDREMLSSVPIPLLSKARVEEIGSMVLQANDLRDHAWINERQAIVRFNEIVENHEQSIL